MCGSGTFVIEACEIASRLHPGRSRNFAFEKLYNFLPEEWNTLKEQTQPITPAYSFTGYDRDKGAIERAIHNSKNAGISATTAYSVQPISALKNTTEHKTGLIITNPPYGIRLGDVKKLTPLYQQLGHIVRTHYKGWRFGLLTNNDKLAKATEIKFSENNVKFSHGGIPVKLFYCEEI